MAQNRSQQQRVWIDGSASTDGQPVDNPEAVASSSRPTPPPPPPPAVLPKQQQDSPGAVEHDASSSGYGSPDSGGLIDEG